MANRIAVASGELLCSVRHAKLGRRPDRRRLQRQSAPQMVRGRFTRVVRRAPRSRPYRSAHVRIHRRGLVTDDETVIVQFIHRCLSNGCKWLSVQA